MAGGRVSGLAYGRQSRIQVRFELVEEAPEEAVAGIAFDTPNLAPIPGETVLIRSVVGRSNVGGTLYAP